MTNIGGMPVPPAVGPADRDALIHAVRRAGVPARDCEDVVQDTLVAALDQRRRGLFRAECPAGAWLRIILRGKIVDYRRRMSRSEQSFGTEARSIRFEDSLHLRFQLLALPARQRSFFLLNAEAGLTIREIAASVGDPPGTVARVLADAKRTLRMRLHPNSEESPARSRLYSRDKQQTTESAQQGGL